MKHIKTIFITLLVLLTCSLMLAGCGRKANALDYVEITFSGSNGNGRAELSMRTLELIESVIGGEPEPNESYSSWLSQYILYDEGITFSCTPEQNLSNGDTVTVNSALTTVRELVNFNYSSRVRKVYLGEVVVWINKFGNFAAREPTFILQKQTTLWKSAPTTQTSKSG